MGKALLRDPIDAASDAELLLQLLDERADLLLATHLKKEDLQRL